MALPAEVALAVRVQVHLGDSASRHGRLAVADCTKGPVGGPCGSNGPGRDPVLFRGLVAGRTRETGVVGDGLLPGDLAVTGTAFLGCAGRLRGVGLVAGRTGGLGVMDRRIDLWESRGHRHS